jgi:hypothetical protein
MLNQIRDIPGKTLDASYHALRREETEHLTGPIWKLERSQYSTRQLPLTRSHRILKILRRHPPQEHEPHHHHLLTRNPLPQTTADDSTDQVQYRASSNR